MAIKGGKWEMSDAEFERQYAEATQRGQASTGLGLSLTRQLVDALGGTIAVEARSGGGTTFRVAVPVRRTDRGGVAADAPEQARGKAGTCIGEAVTTCTPTTLRRVSRCRAGS